MIRVMGLLIVLCSAASGAGYAAAAGCTRESLQATVDKYLDALKKGDPSLMPLGPNAKYMENRNGVPFGEGIWRTPLKVEFNRSQLDVETCQTFT